MNNIVVVDCIRTGLAKAHRGTFNMSRSDDLVAHCINALLERNPTVEPALVEDVVLGCGRQVGEQSGNVARHAVALSNLPITVPKRCLTCIWPWAIPQKWLRGVIR
jgi:acetyl-CoA acyltransferase